MLFTEIGKFGEKNSTNCADWGEGMDWNQFYFGNLSEIQEERYLAVL